MIAINLLFFMTEINLLFFMTEINLLFFMTAINLLRFYDCNLLTAFKSSLSICPNHKSCQGSTVLK